MLINHIHHVQCTYMYGIHLILICRILAADAQKQLINQTKHLIIDINIYSICI